MKPRVLLLGHAPDTAWPMLCEWLRPTFDVLVVNEPLTGSVGYDWLISYRHHWVVPEVFLLPGRAINFHPGPPEYPGIGSTDWALHDKATAFGVTAHHMAAVPDTGPIIAVRRFPIRPHETLATLTQRAHVHMLGLADEVLSYVVSGQPLPRSGDQWVGRPRTRKDLRALQCQ